MKKVTCKGLTMKQTKKGFVVSADYGKYVDTFEHFADATLWIYNMADNNEIGNKMCEKICNKWNRNVYGGLINTYYSEEKSIKLIKENYEISLDLAKRVLFENLTLEYDENEMKYKIYDEKGNLIKEK